MASAENQATYPQATYPQATYPIICFLKTFSPKTEIEITSKSVFISDPIEYYRYTFPGGSAEYYITITESGSKKRPYKTITIKRLMPLCPISKIPLLESEIIASRHGITGYKTSPDRGCKFIQGFAFNCYMVSFIQHKKFNLKPVLYYKIGISAKTDCDIYLVVPIVDGRQLQPKQIDAIYDYIGNMDVINIIAKYYYQLSEKNYDFHMSEDTVIKPDTLYHRQTLINLFHQGQLKLGITNSNFIGVYGYNYDILILEPDAYNYVSPFGKESFLKHMFSTCQNMMKFREFLISKYLI